MWEQHVKEEWFLGSHGKRVGTYFGGVDDLVWFTPKFETSMMCNIKEKKIYEGDFETVNIRPRYVEGENPMYYDDNPYCIYVGGDYGLVQYENKRPSAELKVLIIKDSYMLPLQSYFSTVVSSLDVIDLRYYKEGTLAEYVEKTRPDMVIMMYYPKSFEIDKFFEYGI